MNRIDATFEQLKQQGQTALIPFITIGDPDVQTSLEIIQEMEQAGADLIELGVPYSDPLADGPVIQRASSRALEHQITVVDCIKIAGDARKIGVKLPFILFTYYNPIYQLGFDTLFPLLVENDISGLIIPDLPVEESAILEQYLLEYNIHLIPLVAPTSNDRIAKITEKAKGFIYCVSSLGVTGERTDFYDGVDRFIASVKEATTLPIAVGFGISTNEHFKKFSTQCEGVVVGSAIVRQIEDTIPLLKSESTKQQGLLKIREFVRQLKA